MEESWAKLFARHVLGLVDHDELCIRSYLHDAPDATDHFTQARNLAASQPGTLPLHRACDVTGWLESPCALKALDATRRPQLQ